MTTPRSATLVVLLTAALASGRARAADELMPGKLILVKPGRLAKFIAKPVAGGRAGSVRVTLRFTTGCPPRLCRAIRRICQSRYGGSPPRSIGAPSTIRVIA